MGDWWGWVKSTTDKVVTIYKEDLAEFTKGVSEDTSAVIQNQQISSAVSNVLSKLELTDEKGKENINNEATSTLNPHEAKVLALQNDLETFTKDPEDEAYKEYIKQFKFTTQIKNDASLVLKQNQKVKELSNELTPDQVSEEVFWARYFYRLEKLNEERLRREAILERVEKGPEVDSWDWDDDENKIKSPDVNNDNNNNEKSDQNLNQQQVVNKTEESNNNNNNNQDLIKSKDDVSLDLNSNPAVEQKHEDEEDLEKEIMIRTQIEENKIEEEIDNEIIQRSQPVPDPHPNQAVQIPQVSQVESQPKEPQIISKEPEPVAVQETKSTSNIEASPKTTTSVEIDDDWGSWD
eukprot:TRINITY_DN10856_c0_g1_i1.p1 TRINITY_DN10856_c0_g1~~TRINITY_DN10856_c0_g1_i1.p1  ORF type:complete len:350 (-),score=144.25 TRINITY_DN10856_c0_g1_i1:26-1075(-)